MATHRASRAEKEQRITQMVRMISNGAVTSDLVRYAASEWGVGSRQADDYIAAARKVIIDDINQDRHVVVAELLHTCKTIVRKTMANGEYSNCIGAMNLITRLGGLDQNK